MPDKKVIPLRFYPKTDADLIEWLECLAAGEGNETIKAMLRAGIMASQNCNACPTQSISSTSMATLDPASLQVALEGFLPRIREIVDASLASANFIRSGSETALQDESTASADLLNGHLVGDEEEN
jgi:hypothetical protein